MYKKSRFVPKVSKVLLIEDNRLEAGQTQEWLEGSPFKVECVDRLKLAIERLKKGGIDLVILDLNLPDSRGEATFERLHAEIPEIPVVVLTGEFDEDTGPRTVAKGAQDYLVKKQSDSDSLVHVVRHAIARHRAQTEKINSLQGPKPARLIGFVGAKGGVGTTTLALNIAVALAIQGKSVILVEMRSAFGTLALHLNQHPDRNLRSLLKIPAEQIDRQELKAVLCSGPAGVSILFGPQEIDLEIEEIDPLKCKAILDGLSQLADFVLLDLPNQPSAATRVAVSVCHQTAVVTEREPGSVSAGRVAVNQLLAWGLQRSLAGGIVLVGSVIVNRTLYSNYMMSFADIKSQMGCEIIGIVPNGASESLRAMKESVPLVLLEPESDTALNILDLANRLSEGNIVGSLPGQGFSLMKSPNID